jgi:hypothetical protein
MDSGLVKIQEAQGTKVAGVVTNQENKPPRECWNCIHYPDNMKHSCVNEYVNQDPEVKDNPDGSKFVEELWCCNYFRSKGQKSLWQLVAEQLMRLLKLA